MPCRTDHSRQKTFTSVRWRSASEGFGPNHAYTASTIVFLAQLYCGQDRFAEAEGLLKRALLNQEKAYGKNHGYVAMILDQLAEAYIGQNRYDEAEAVTKRSLAINEKGAGATTATMLSTLEVLADINYRQKRYREAESLMQRALGITRSAFGENYPIDTYVLDRLGLVYQMKGRFSEAEASYKRALAADPQDSPALINLAELYATLGDIENAVLHSRKAIAAVNAHAAAEAARAPSKVGASGSARQITADFFRLHVANLSAATRKAAAPTPALDSEAFEVAQQAEQSSAASAVHQLGLRFAAGNDALAALVRERQDLTAFWRERDSALIEALSQARGQANQSTVEKIRKQIAETETRLMRIVARIEKEFPDYAALAGAKPLKADEVPRMLGPNDALVFYLTGPKEFSIGNKETYVFALTREGFVWKAILLGADGLAEKVTAFRRGLDVEALHRGLVRTDCTQAQAKSRGLSRAECGRVLANECEEASLRGLARDDCTPADGPRELFDLALAHGLYGTLIGPVEGLIKDKKHLIVVPSGPLTALPFHLLLTEKPAVAVPQMKRRAILPLIAMCPGCCAAMR